MRKWIFLFVIVIFNICLLLNLHAKKSVLIDFNLLKANGNGMEPEKSLGKDDPKIKDYKDYDDVNRKHHMPTLLDYSAIAGSSFTEEELKGMSTSLAPYNWDVTLNSSAAHVENRMFSHCKEWHTKFVPILAEELTAKEAEAAAASTAPEGLTILGIRICFPETSYNCWAVIKPPFEIPAYENIDTDYKGAKLSDEEAKKNENLHAKYENGYGVVKNVGVIKSIDLRVFGNQFKNSISILLKDDNNIVTEYMMSQYLDFDGWRKITWKNPNYIADAANRDLYIIPLYPRNTPFVKLYGFRIYRQGDQVGGNFVTYIKDVYVTYDEAVLDREVAIDHEEAWGILQQRTIEAKNRELRKIGYNQVLRFIERKKMHKETSSE